MKTEHPPADPRYRALLQLLRTADSLWKASRLFFERWDLSPSQFNVLNLLEGLPGGLSQTELSRQLIMHRSNLTGLVDHLEQRGLVARKDVAADRRAYRVVLTPEGAALLRKILPHYYERSKEVWGNLPKERLPQFIADLERVAENTQSVAAELAPTTIR